MLLRTWHGLDLQRPQMLRRDVILASVQLFGIEDDTKFTWQGDRAGAAAKHRGQRAATAPRTDSTAAGWESDRGAWMLVAD